MLDVHVEDDVIRIGRHFSVTFQRTLRIPDDGGTYPLPPGLGAFPVRRVTDYADRVPPSWREHGGVFIPMYQREALWLSFAGSHWHPTAVKIAVGKVNALTGEPWKQTLDGEAQDYLVVPDQPWLDGINAGDGMIRQFVAMPLGMGYTVEGQVTGEEKFGGIQIIAFDAKPGRFPEEPPPPPVYERHTGEYVAEDDGGYASGPMLSYSDVSPMSYTMAEAPPPAMAAGGAEMGLGAGGQMEQKIYPDEHGVDTWDQETFGRVYVHIVNSLMYREITGEEAPPTPVTARTYTEYGYPWFALYDEHRGDVAASETLKGVKSIKQMDESKGFGPQQDDGTVPLKDGQVKKLALDPTKVPDGKW